MHGREVQEFNRLWFAESISLIGREVTTLAIPLVAVTVLGASAAEIGWLGAARYAPYLVLALPFGVVVDVLPRRPILIASDLVQAGALASVPVLALAGRLTLPLLVGITLVVGTAQMAFVLAFRSYLPQVVDREDLTPANARLSASESAAAVAGPGASGTLTALIGPALTVALDVVTLMVAALTLGLMRTREPRRRRLTADRWYAPVVEGASFTYRNPYLRASSGEAATYNFCWQIVLTLIVLFTVEELGWSPMTVGVTLSVGALGALLGALLAPRAASRFRLGRVILVAVALSDVAPLAIPFLPPGQLGIVVAGCAFFVQGVGMTGCNVHIYALRQTVTPEHLMGRTNASYQFLTQGVIPLGALSGGLLGETIGLRGGLLVGCVGLLTTVVWFWLSPVRSLVSMPGEAPGPTGDAPVSPDRVAAASG